MTDANHFRGRTLAALCACLLVTTNAYAAIGRTPGSAMVTSSGQAAYSIPLPLPTGTNGLTPGISLEYRHDNPGGLVGVGWSIGGLSAITRCRSTFAQDGVITSNTVHYCLDGSRLVVSNGLPYNDSSAEYRTEIESFSRVRRYGGAPNWVPDYFIVEGADGLIREYGATTDSRGGWAWRISKIRDHSGNQISFAYTIDGNSRRIERISYNANPVQAVAASHEILFVYENRPSNEVDLAYVFGTPVRTIVRLDKIDVRYNGTLLKRYELSYEPYLSSAGHSRLASLQECGVGGSDCFAPTNLAWQNGTNSLTAEQTTTIPQPSANTTSKTIALADVNGDGRDDLIWSNSSYTVQYRLAQSTGGFGPQISTSVYAYLIVPFDYNGDGFADLLTSTQSGSPFTWVILPGTVSGFGSPINTGVPLPNMLFDFRGVDMNGDGLGDIAYSNCPSNPYNCGIGYNDLGVRVRLALPGGGFSSTETVLYEQYWYYGEYFQGGTFIGQPGQIIDLDGDGGEDLLLHENYSIAKISLTEHWIDNFNGIGDLVAALDVNGDRCEDILYHDMQNWRVRFSACAGLGSVLPELLVPPGTGGAPVPIDWSGDGKDGACQKFCV